MIEILLATYNGERYLAEQLDSLLCQTYKDFCILIRDDGSNDMTCNIINEYIKKFPKKIELIKDSLGNTIKIDKYKTIVCDVKTFTQFKSVQINGQVYYKDLINKQLIDTFPLESEFVFEHSYATYNGNKNALDDNYVGLIKKRAVTFPSNEQMIYDSGEDLKLKLKYIINNQYFR